jgi:hypothetical protein
MIVGYGKQGRHSPMKTPMLGMMACLALMAFVPAVHAGSSYTCDPTYTVCVGQYDYSYGSCGSGFGYSNGGDYANANTPVGNVNAGGSSYSFCYGSFSYQGTNVGAGACTYAGTFNCGGVSWYSFSVGSSSYCNTYVYDFGPAGFVYEPLGCPAGAPPNPGWGTLLP